MEEMTQLKAQVDSLRKDLNKLVDATLELTRLSETLYKELSQLKKDFYSTVKTTTLTKG